MSVKNRIIVFVLAFLVLSNTFYVALTYTYYFVDPSGFTAQFCVNTDKPEMKCNGKCHLKEVSKKDATNDKEPAKMMATKEVVLFIQEKEKIDFGFIIYVKKENKIYSNLYSYLGEYALYHPPQGSLT